MSLPTISLVSQRSIMTEIINDDSISLCLAHQVFGCSSKYDI